MPKRCSRCMDGHICASMDQRSNTRSSWSGMQPTASAPNGSSLFSPRLSKLWSGMSTSTSPRSARSQLLSMSAATADRLLRSMRKRGQGGLSTTRAGTLLKQQIPIRTFEEWKETRPGLTSSGPGSPLWYRHRGRLPVHLDPHRYSDWVDEMSAPLASERGAGPGCPPKRTHTLSLSDPGHRYR